MDGDIDLARLCGDRGFVVPVLVVFVLIGGANGVTERQAAAFGYHMSASAKCLRPEKCLQHRHFALAPIQHSS